jgi:hypothetical protein
VPSPNEITWDDEIQWDEPAPAAEPPAPSPGDALRLLGSGATYGLMPQASAALEASAPWLFNPLAKAAGQPEGSTAPNWMDRYRANREKYEGLREGSRERSGLMGTGTELLGGLATGGVLGKAVMPLSKLAANAPAMARAGAGVADASLMSGGLGALSEWDTSPAAAAGQGAVSPLNLLGAGPGVVAGMNRLRPKALDLIRQGTGVSPSEVGALRESIGSLPKQGAVAARLATPEGKPVFPALASPERRLANIEATLKMHGAPLDAIVAQADAAAPTGVMEAKPLLREIKRIVGEVDTMPERVTNSSKATREVVGFLRRLRDETGLAPGQEGLRTSFTATEMRALKRALDDKVFVLASDKERPASVIQRDPKLRALRELAGLFRTKEEEAIGKALGPDALEQFKLHKTKYEEAVPWQRVVERKANEAASAQQAGAYDVRHLLLPLAGASAGGSAGFSSGGAGGGLTGAALGALAGFGSDKVATALSRYGASAGGRTLERLANKQGTRIDPQLAALLEALRTKEKPDAP